ncbi:MAG TPA: Ig-like domain-containing protein, partial [Candidatus Sulfomarinibacteraceae bacterium]|nr:Ig-like domain-containing protein [Candidatus Sulfomarinibacteraceae bacterium]
AGAPLALTLIAVGDGSEAEVVPGDALADDAEHVLEIDAAITDRAGHPLEAAAVATFTTRDGTPPQPPILDPVVSPACFVQLMLTGLAEPGTRVAAEGDVRPASVIAAADGAFSLALEPTVGEGAVEVEVTAEDAAGNVSAPAYLAVELDCTAPRVTASDWDGGSMVSVRYSEALDPDSVVMGGSATLDGSFGPLPFTLEVAGAVVTLELAETPAADELPLRLALTSEITDAAGNAAVPYTQLFAEPGVGYFIIGEVFADRTSLELAGARVVLEEAGGPVAGDPTEVTADGRGRYRMPVVGSPVTVRIEAEGYLPAWRRVVPLAGAATLLFDVRLSERAAVWAVTGADRLEAGDARLTISGAAVPADGLEVALSPLSEQGLPDLLPLGWRPLAAAHVGLDDGVVLDPPAVLQLATSPPPDAVVARYDPEVHAWSAVADGATVEVAAAGSFALVVPDPEPTSPGLAVPGSFLPSAAAADPGVMSATLDLDPAVILPMETALATVTTQPASPVPSGHPVEVRLDELLHAVGGGVIVVPPTAVDLVLYRQPDGSLAASFGLGATETARRIALDEGVKNIVVRSLPGTIRTQDLVSPSGAELLGADGVGLEIPEGAVDRVLGVSLSARPTEPLPIALPPGLEAVAAADLDLGDTVLFLPATLSFPGAGESGGQYLLLSPVEAAGSTHWRLVGLGALEDERLVCGPAQLGGLPAPGVRRSGLYVLARPTGEAWALLAGTVLDVDGEPATATCLVTAAGGLAQLTDGAGAWAVAAPGGIVDLAALQLASFNAGSQEEPAAAGVVTDGLEIALQVVAPRVVATSPADGADRVSTAVPVTVDFSEPLD